jgi:hypothetical protein
MNTTRHTEKHPNELLGIDVDSARPGLRSNDVVTGETVYRRMKCYNLMTGDFVGYLGTYNNNVDLVGKPEEAAKLAWSSYGSDMYLRKDTSPNDRYLGLGWNSYACWGLTGGWNDAVIFNKDKTISLKSDPKRKLYKYGNNWVCWSADEDNQNILRFEFEP